jgi:AcrR family transcriptional regulator
MAVNRMESEAADEEPGTGLPASIEAAWGVRGRRPKGPRPHLSLDRIVEAGVRVAAAEGLAAVSMGRVAAELGASPMSLYRYVAAKDELLALMVDAASHPAPDPPAPDEGWREGLARWAWAYHAALRRHPWILRIPISGPPATPNQIRWLEVGLTCLRGTGLAEREKLSIVILLSGFVRQEATLSADVDAAIRAAGATPEQTVSRYGRALARLTDPLRFPALRAVIDCGVFDEPDDPDGEFVFGLERLLDGVEALVRSRA